MSASSQVRKAGCTQHYLQRCRERNIPADANQVVTRYGRARRNADGTTVHYLDALSAWRLVQRGLDLWCHVGVAVVIAADGAALTTYRFEER